MKTDAMAQGKILLMACGSFSPPTPMHLRMFEIARDYLHGMGINTVIGGIISPVHDAYGKKDLISATHRCAMLKIALKSSDWIKMSDWEVNQEGWTRTRVSLQYHQDHVNSFLNGTQDNNRPASWLPDELISRILNNNLDEVDNFKSISFNNERNNGESENVRVRIKLLCGGDLLESFATPGLWKEEDLESILGNHGLVVISRNGSNPEKFIYESDVLTRFRRNITIVTNWVANEVSSTVIRRLLRRGESVKYLIDDSIIAYIRQNHLYGSYNTAVIDNTKYLIPLNLTQPSSSTTPSPNDVSMESPHPRTESAFRNIYITMVDAPTNLNIDDVLKSNNKRRLDNEDVKLPGKVVKITTDSKGNHIVDNKVSKGADLSLDFKNMSIGDAADVSPRSVSPSTPKSPQRSYEEIIKFIFTEHGIEVISDKEAIV